VKCSAHTHMVNDTCPISSVERNVNNSTVMHEAAVHATDYKL
jgi:hypothetical protein